MTRQPNIVVVGAGLAGLSVALELAARGSHVTLVDQDDHPMHRASRRNEGKIHLGFVYANESYPRTAQLMVQGALSFGPLLHRWVGPAVKRVLTPSRPFDGGARQGSSCSRCAWRGRDGTGPVTSPAASSSPR